MFLEDFCPKALSRTPAKVFRNFFNTFSQNFYQQFSSFRFSVFGISSRTYSNISHSVPSVGFPKICLRYISQKFSMIPLLLRFSNSATWDFFQCSRVFFLEFQIGIFLRIISRIFWNELKHSFDSFLKNYNTLKTRQKLQEKCLEEYWWNPVEMAPATSLKTLR